MTAQEEYDQIESLIAYVKTGREALRYARTKDRALDAIRKSRMEAHEIKHTDLILALRHLQEFIRP